VRVGEFVTVTTDGDGVATIRLDRAPVNALSEQVFAEIGEAAAACTADESVAAVVVWGGPKVFAAGADIKEMADADLPAMAPRARLFQDALRTLERVPKVVIAAIDGYALGGGCELALAADFRFAAANAKLGQPEILLGLLPGAGGTQRLPRLVGVQKAKELIYSGDMVTADEAYAIGLVDRVTGPEDCYEQALTEARRYAQGPYALGFAKRAIDEGAELDLDAALRLESSLFTAAFATEDARTGMRSFVEEGPGKARFSRR
jgi:enoyl-CoA hydratase/carnithine racemase